MLALLGADSVADTRAMLPPSPHREHGIVVLSVPLHMRLLISHALHLTDLPYSDNISSGGSVPAQSSLSKPRYMAHSLPVIPTLLEGDEPPNLKGLNAEMGPKIKPQKGVTAQMGPNSDERELSSAPSSPRGKRRNERLFKSVDSKAKVPISTLP